MAGELIPEAPSASRQKSCQACVKGKRGCDKRRPVCSRCEEKKIQCVYAKRTYIEAFNDYDSAELDISWTAFGDLLPSVGFVEDTTPGFTFPTGLDSNRLLTSDVPIEPFLTFLDTQAAPSSDMHLIKGSEEQPSQQQEDEQALSKFDYAQMADLCMRYEPWQVYDPNTKVHFIVQNIKGYPGAFAKDSHTPWMHRHLYKDQVPSSIQSCLAASALYSNITRSNKASVFRVIYQSLSELKEQQLMSTPVEKLARAQALLIYQIIGLFDGDITLRSNVDRNMSLLHDWIDELCKIRENLKAPESMKTTDPPRSWEWWIFAESVRRTIVIAYAFLGLWNMMSENNEDAFFRAWKYLHCWTIARPLWEAPSSFDFFQRWKVYHAIENFEFESFVKTGRADDVDEFSKVFMVAYMGLDETKQWFMDNGCVF